MREWFPDFVVHDAGEPHEGTQACRRCGFVLVEQPADGMWARIEEAGGTTILGEGEAFAYFEPGPVSASAGRYVASGLPGAAPCRS